MTPAHRPELTSVRIHPSGGLRQLQEPRPSRAAEDGSPGGLRGPGAAPDYLAIPVGNAGNISAYWKGFTEYRDAGVVETTPVLLASRRMSGAVATGRPSRTRRRWQPPSASVRWRARTGVQRTPMSPAAASTP
ncbi:MAG: hypothetical protein R3C32_06410 [Chloroflexota bacterium]